MIRKYQNELILLAALLFLVGSFIFELTQQHKLDSAQKTAAVSISRLEDTAILKKLWVNNKTIASRLQSIKNYVGSSKVEKFKLNRTHADIVLTGLSGSQLNVVVGKYIASTPVQIESLQIKRDNDTYGLELKCNW